jgi:hypothetical protein
MHIPRGLRQPQHCSSAARPGRGDPPMIIVTMNIILNEQEAMEAGA